MKQNNESTTTNTPPFVFFGGPQISCDFLDTLKKYGIVPSLIVTTPDKPAGRKLVLTSPPLKDWADKNTIPVIQPKSLKKFDTVSLGNFDLFVVVAYGKIIPKHILDIPKHGSINLHPSLLPKYRGPSPIQSALLADDKQTGISLMLLDEKMDHGPVIAQENIQVEEWLKNRDMEQWFAAKGAELFFTTLPLYLEFSIATEQDHDKATECKKFTKADMQIDPTKPRDAYLRYCAFDKPFFFLGDTRVIVTQARWDNDFVIERVIPAGKKEVSWSDFKKSRH